MLNGPLRSNNVNGASSTNFVSEVSSHVLFIHSERKSEFLENKLDRFWSLDSIGVLGNEKHSQGHFIESIYLDEKKLV